MKQLKNPFSKYAMNEAGCLINIKTGNEVTISNGSVRLVNDGGERVTLRTSDFESKLKVSDQDAVKEIKAKKEKAPKKEKAQPNQGVKKGDIVSFYLYRSIKKISTEVIGFSKFHNGKLAVVVKVDGKRSNKSLTSLL